MDKKKDKAKKETELTKEHLLLNRRALTGKAINQMINQMGREVLLVRRCSNCKERKFDTFQDITLMGIERISKEFFKAKGVEEHFSHFRSESNYYCGVFEPYEIYELRKRRD